ncbi:MAG: biotin/lipoyl-binding protein, partial [Prevotella sp.]|nr:biotin/lipoyl-binding protein [Prevotella sp.]
MNKRRKKTLANIVIVLLILAGIGWIASVFVHVGGEYTDNAQVEQDIVNVNARVEGFVERIYAGEYSRVHRGDTLLTIDDSEFRLHLAQAEAGLQNALADRAAT